MKLAYNENDDKYYVSVPLLCSSLLPLLLIPLCPPRAGSPLPCCFLTYAFLILVACKELNLPAGDGAAGCVWCQMGGKSGGPPYITGGDLRGRLQKRIADLSRHFLAMKQVT